MFRIEEELANNITGSKIVKTTDLVFTAFLLIQKDIKLIDIKRTEKSKHQFCFIINNNSSKSIKQWILDYQNNEVLVSIHEYNKKLNDLRDLINSDFND